MDHQNIILPNIPLVIVDRGWQRSKRNNAAGATPSQGSPRNSAPTGERNPVDDIVITTMEPSNEGLTESKDRTGHEESGSIRPRSTKNFQFVNTTKPSQIRDPDVRKLVRGHVKKEMGGDPTRAGTRSSAHPKERKLTKRTPALSELSPVISGSATSFYGSLPFAMKPRFHSLMNYYLYVISHTLYPLEVHLSFNPVKEAWFPLAITDEVLFHTILVSAAAQLSLVRGQQDPQEQNTLMEPIFRQLGRILKDQTRLSDASIGAVSCLAMTENMLGNFEKWGVHMRGLAEMIRMRGGLQSIDQSLQTKIYRADIEGAVDFVQAPHLAPFKRSLPPIWSMLPLAVTNFQRNEFLEILSASNVSPQLMSTLFNLIQFTRAVEYTLGRNKARLDPQSFDEDILLIQYQLFSFLDRGENEIEKACRLGALIYVKTLTREMPFSRARPSVVVTKLKDSLVSVFESPRMTSLLLWLLFMGGIASRGSAEQTWFTEKLFVVTTNRGQFSRWDCVKKALKKILWIDLIHEGPCKELWDAI